jgi:hypothetical protein
MMRTIQNNLTINRRMNMTTRNLKTKLAAVCLTGATVFGMMAPMTANAATISPTPTAKKTLQ